MFGHHLHHCGLNCLVSEELPLPAVAPEHVVQPGGRGGHVRDTDNNNIKVGNININIKFLLEDEVGLEVMSQVEPHLVTKCRVNNDCVPALVQPQQLLQSIRVGLHAEVEEVGLEEISPSEQMLGGRHVSPVPEVEVECEVISWHSHSSHLISAPTSTLITFSFARL